MKPFSIIDAPQRSPEWFQSRLGRLTGSVAGDMLAKIKSGEAAGRRNLRIRLVLERLTGCSMDDGYVSPAMQAGIDREAQAFAAYEALTGELVQRTGFLAHNVHMAGCSLDGHIGDFTELLSIKCRQPAAHLEFLKSETVPADALAQIRHELWITGAEAEHYFSFNPDFPEALRLGVRTFHARDMEIPAYEDAALKFLAEVENEYLAVRTMADVKDVLRGAVA